jgi:dTDP-glucose 4,6-dehydratase/UDP-glucose 4-epimerase
MPRLVKILVTGGLGFLGSRLCQALASEGHEVAALDNGFRDSGEHPSGVRAIDADVRDADAVRAACRGANVVVHLAAIQGTGNFYAIPDQVLDVNLRGTLNVADACADEGVERLVFSSSSEVYGEPTLFPTPEEHPLSVPDPHNPRYSYGASKLAGELIVVNAARVRGFEFTVLRYHNVYGPAMGWDHVIPQFIRRLELGEEFTIQGDGTQTRSFCYVEDAVAATVAAVTAPTAANEILNVGNPEEIAIDDLAALLGRVAGKPVEPRHVPFKGEGTRRRVPDVRRAREVLGFEPRVPLEEGLRETYRWYAEQLAREEVRA